MHTLQRAILDLAESKNLKKMSLREIGKAVTGQDQSPQKIKYHVDRLLREGYLRHDESRDTVTAVSREKKRAGFTAIPVLGHASCGPATQIVENNVQGYLWLSERFVPRNQQNLFIIRAVGRSMNRARVNGKKTIEDGDFVLIDGKKRQPETGKYVLAVTGEVANIKKFVQDKNAQTMLISESSEDFSPIYIHPDDQPDFYVCGQVLDVFKKPDVDSEKKA